MEDKKQRRKRFHRQKEFSEYGNGLQEGSTQGARLCHVTRSLRRLRGKEDKGSYIKHKALHGLREDVLEEQLYIRFGSCCSRILKLSLMATQRKEVG